jgi:hypothetical protein
VDAKIASYAPEPLTQPAFGTSEEHQASRDTVRSMLRGVREKCPNCGKGALYSRYLKVNSRCPGLLTAVHHRLRLLAFPMRTRTARSTLRCWSAARSPGSRTKSFCTCQGLRPRRVVRALALTRPSCPGIKGHADEFIRIGWPLPPDLRPGKGNHDPALGGRGDFLNLKYDISFSDIGFLRETSGLPVVVKGVVHPQDTAQSLRP